MTPLESTPFPTTIPEARSPVPQALRPVFDPRKSEPIPRSLSKNPFAAPLAEVLAEPRTHSFDWGSGDFVGLFAASLAEGLADLRLKPTVYDAFPLFLPPEYPPMNHQNEQLTQAGRVLAGSAVLSAISSGNGLPKRQPAPVTRLQDGRGPHPRRGLIGFAQEKRWTAGEWT